MPMQLSVTARLYVDRKAEPSLVDWMDRHARRNQRASVVIQYLMEAIVHNRISVTANRPEVETNPDEEVDYYWCNIGLKAGAHDRLIELWEQLPSRSKSRTFIAMLKTSIERLDRSDTGHIEISSLVNSSPMIAEEIVIEEPAGNDMSEEREFEAPKRELPSKDVKRGTAQTASFLRNLKS